METRSFPAVLDSLVEMRRFARDVALIARVGEKKSYQLQLAVDEIATNIISYGYGDLGPSSTITMSCDIRDGRLVVTLEDQAPAFDPREVLQPETEDVKKPLEERRIGGLGIYLAVNGVDRFDYRREGGSNVNIFEVGTAHDRS